MDTTSHWKVPIRRLTGPKKAWLELKGTILIYHETGWMGSASVFIPIEWVSLSRRRRYHGHWLIRGLVFVAIFLASSSVALMIGADPRGGNWLAGAMWTSAAIAICGCIFCGVAFLRRKPTTLLSVDTEPQSMEIEFWHDPDSDEGLTSLLQKVRSVRDRIDDVAPYPIQSSHTWYRLRPFRAVIAKGFTFSAILYIPVTLLSRYFEMPYLALFLLLPPIFYLARYGFDWMISLDQPKAFRKAVKLYDQGEYAEAETLLRHCAEEERDNQSVLFLWIYVCLEQRKFDEAFDICRRLARLNDEAAEGFTTEIWAMKRMYDRMDIDTDTPNAGETPAPRGDEARS